MGQRAHGRRKRARELRLPITTWSHGSPESHYQAPTIGSSKEDAERRGIAGERYVWFEMRDQAEDDRRQIVRMSVEDAGILADAINAELDVVALTVGDFLPVSADRRAAYLQRRAARDARSGSIVVNPSDEEPRD